MRITKTTRLVAVALGLVAVALLGAAPGSAVLANQPGSVRITR
ncbi:hypothetical protein [Umezawaea sp. Da 62-37]|nr:hypothetical protein [Umezawaea sp. Da 62-37]WNV91575.1 hypothetical protein RM788_25940 [Umezawaea sp. Da 62-37]